MNTATPMSWSDFSVEDPAEMEFRSIFEHAPIAAAFSDARGLILLRNSAFNRTLRQDQLDLTTLRLCDLVPHEERDAIDRLLQDLQEGKLEHIHLHANKACADWTNTNWTAWRPRGQSKRIYILGDPSSVIGPTDEGLLQAQRWESIGRVAGGVIHDFNNLLGGVMLYCDLLLSSLDPIDRRRRYAEEIRSAIIQSTGLVKQMLGFTRPQPAQLRSICLNQIIEAMQDLLTRLIGSNIALEFRLDPDLGSLKMDPTQAQQVILNLVLNARDALPNGGRIVIETSNCKFQSVSGSTLPRHSVSAFPCVLLVVGDNGHGMDAPTRKRLFEPFFTTKPIGKGTGLGLTTVRGIVTTNRGLIHVESESGQGTRVMILLPRSSPSTDVEVIAKSNLYSVPPLASAPLQEEKKESLL